MLEGRDEKPDRVTHQLAKRPSSDVSKPSTIKPVLKRDRTALDLTKLEIDFPQPTTDLSEEALREEFVRVDQEIDALESDRAREIIERVMPEFTKHRLAQSPARIAGHINAYGEEALEASLPKFRGHFEAYGSALGGVADRVLRESTS